MNKNNLLPTLLTAAMVTGFSSPLYAALPAKPVVTNITAVMETTNDSTPDYTFNTTVAGTILYGGDCASKTTAAVVGHNTVTFNRLKSGNHYNCSIKVKNSAGIVSAALAVPGFKVNYSAGVKVTVTTMEDLKADGTVEGKRISTHDFNGRLIKETWTKTGGTVKNIILNTYDSHGNIVSAKNYEGGLTELRTTNVYDTETGNLTKKITNLIIAGESSPAGTRTYTYDAKRQITSETVSGEGDGKYTIQYAYANGKLSTKKIDYNNDGVIETTISNTYNALGNLTKKATSFISAKYGKVSVAINIAYNDFFKISKMTVSTSNPLVVPAASFTISYDESKKVKSYRLETTKNGVAYAEQGTVSVTGDTSLSNDTLTEEILSEED